MHVELQKSYLRLSIDKNKDFMLDGDFYHSLIFIR